MSRGIARLLAALMSAVVLGACGAASSPDGNAGGATPSGDTGGLSGEPVLIGIGVAETSPVALLGQEEVIGARIAEAFFNERGGPTAGPSSSSSRTPAATSRAPSTPSSR